MGSTFHPDDGTSISGADHIPELELIGVSGRGHYPSDWGGPANRYRCGSSQLRVEPSN